MTFDPTAATATLIDSLGADALAKSAAYTAGGHWLLLWDLVVSALVTLLIVRLGVLEKAGARFENGRPNRRALVIGLCYFAVSWLLALPWTLYAQWWRELGYGRTSQPLPDFLVQGLLSMVVNALVAALFFVGVYALIGRAGARWWAWSALLTAFAISAMLLLSPIVIEPLFNDYTPVPQGEVRDALSAMAERAGIPPDRIYQYDGSRQSNNFTANVSGIGASARIAISDVAFKGASLEEVKAVTGHEIGHYVSGHLWRIIAMLSMLAGLGFFLADRLYTRFARVFGTSATLVDPASLPVLLFMVSVFATLATPLMNTVSRIDELDADRYSLDTVRLPDALATALVKSAEYRYPRPRPVEEFLFYSHPSVERRVLEAMRWKAAAASTNGH